MIFVLVLKLGKKPHINPGFFLPAKQREEPLAGWWNVQPQMLTALLCRVQNPAGCLFFQFWNAVTVCGRTSWLLSQCRICAGCFPQDLILEAAELLGLCLRMAQMVPGVTLSLLVLSLSAPSSKWLVAGSFIPYPLFLFAFSRSWSWAICPVFVLFCFVLWDKSTRTLHFLLVFFFPVTVWDN